MSWDGQGEAQAALRNIVANPRYGPVALSNPQTLSYLLQHMLPDAPGETSVLVAAAETGVPSMLHTHLAQGADLATAWRRAVEALETRTGLAADACQWAVGALVSALGLDLTDTRPGGGPHGGAGPADTAAGGGAGFAARAGTGVAAGAGAGVGVGPSGPAGPGGLRIAAAAVAGAGAALTVWACALPDIKLPGGSGQTSFSIFNTGNGGGIWFAAEPVTVSVIAVAAALLVVLARGRLRLVATGVLVGVGLQTIALFAGYQFSVRNPEHAGQAGAVGMLAGAALLAAGLLAAFSRDAAEY
jgi:hypothetical protein